MPTKILLNCFYLSDMKCSFSWSLRMIISFMITSVIVLLSCNVGYLCALTLLCPHQVSANHHVCVRQNPTWRSLDFGMLPDLLDTSVSCFVVRIWGGQEERYQLLIEWKVNLDGLRYTGQQVSNYTCCRMCVQDAKGCLLTQLPLVHIVDSKSGQIWSETATSNCFTVWSPNSAKFSFLSGWFTVSYSCCVPVFWKQSFSLTLDIAHTRKTSVE